MISTHSVADEHEDNGRDSAIKEFYQGTPFLHCTGAENKSHRTEPHRFWENIHSYIR